MKLNLLMVFNFFRIMSEFNFKQFAVQQDKCAMKIGTDSVLLGAWCPIDNHPFSVLDIGAGTVSYTHLDVYKRQALYWLFLKFAPHCQ